MPESLPSLKTVIADVPEIKSFRARFHYNYFQKDERTNDTGQATKEFLRKRSSENFDAKFVESDQFNRFTSRYIRLDWRPVAEIQSFEPPGFTIAANIDKIHEEQHFIGDTYSNVAFQDLGADERVRYFVQELADRQQQRDRPGANDVPDDKPASPLDQVKVMNALSSGSIDPCILVEALEQPEIHGYIFRDNQNRPIENTTLLKELGGVQFFSQVNNKVMVEMLRSVSENSMSIFADEVEDFIDSIEAIQEEALSAKDSAVLDARDYDLEISEFIDYRPLDAPGHEPRVQIVGYLIEKVEIAEDGSVTVQNPIILESPNISTTVDVKIKYGSTYKYSIRSIALFETQAKDAETNENLIVQYLIASKASEVQMVDCVETMPPPCPVDFKVRWDSFQKASVLEWSFPSNPQRDIKGWQIFRRSDISQPFELQAAYDFDNSVVRGHDAHAETPDPGLIQRMSSPKNFYIDKGFNKESKYIYAVCSVDARGLSSNYSQQILVSFNRFKNSLVRTLISPSDAPKPYPNFYLLHDTFVDTIRDSGHKKLRIVFNPEYLNVVDSNLNNLRLLRTNLDANYQLSLINTDLQIQENIQIKLLDKRTNGDQDIKIKEKRLLQNRRDVFDRLRKSRNRR